MAADIINHFIDNNLFSEVHFGFRSKRSCETSLQSILEKWKESVEAKQTILALYIDFKKAFDIIDPELLFIKLFHYGIDNIYLCLFRDYFKNRFQVTCINKATSDRLPLHLSVPQGSILSPLLFNIFINDLSLAVSKPEVILFADDTLLFIADESYEKNLSLVTQHIFQGSMIGLITTNFLFTGLKLNI